MVTTSGLERVLIKGRIAGGRFFTRTRPCDTDQPRALKSAAAVELSWGLNGPFCSIPRNRDSQCFTVGRITPKIVPSCGRFEPCDSLEPLESAPKRHLDRFSCFCTAHPCAQHTDRQTDRHLYSMRCGLELLFRMRGPETCGVLFGGTYSSLLLHL